jgi:tRNA G26 N,N-dimethylase Trm1
MSEWCGGLRCGATDRPGLVGADTQDNFALWDARPIVKHDTANVDLRSIVAVAAEQSHHTECAATLTRDFVLVWRDPQHLAFFEVWR